LEGLLTLFVALTAIGIMVQAGVLIAIYMISKRTSEQLERFTKEARELMVPMRSVATNLKTVSEDLIELGLSAKEQVRRVEAMVTDAGQSLQVQIQRFDQVSKNIVERIDETTEAVQDSILSPVREVSAFAKGLTRGFQAFFLRRQRNAEEHVREDEELFI
jgi:methylthioribose-1-phosphate isomerase